MALQANRRLNFMLHKVCVFTLDIVNASLLMSFYLAASGQIQVSVCYVKHLLGTLDSKWVAHI